MPNEGPHMKNSKKNQSKYKLLWESGQRSRICPKCSSTITHKDKWSYIYACSENKICKTCQAREQSELNRVRFCGNGNPFYGKKHSKETIKKLKNQDISHCLGERNIMKTPKMRKYFSDLYSGAGNPRYGKPVLDETRKKLSKANTGKNNPMYGKPSPNGSGNGWASWYKGMHFRSLRELQYYITEIEPNKILCENGQQRRFRCEYKKYDGTERTYHPDFFVDGKYLIEVKPKALWNTPLIQLKAKAAKKLCRKMGWEYKLIDIQPDSSILKDKYLNGEIKFVEKYKERFEKYAGIK